MSNSFSVFSEEHQKKLDSFNADVLAAVRNRDKWLDSITETCSKFKPGDAIYDLRKLTFVGKVRKILRVADNSLDSASPVDFSVYLRVSAPQPENAYGWQYQQPSGLDFTINDFDCDRYGTKAEYEALLAQNASDSTPL